MKSEVSVCTVMDGLHHIYHASECIATNNEELTYSEGSVYGFLYKWVNFRRGWRQRFFVLRGVVLSYYKFHVSHGLPCVCIKQQMNVPGKTSHELSKRMLDASKLENPCGQVHLQVSTIHKSESDDRQFYIYTGTSTIHICAKTKMGRDAWVDALDYSKKKLQCSLLVQCCVPCIVTGQLRRRLMREGLAEEVIMECEAIVRDEFSLLLGQIKVLEEEQISLTERIKQLEGDIKGDVQPAAEIMEVNEEEDIFFDANSDFPGSYSSNVSHT